MRRIFITTQQIADGIITVSGEDVSHIRDVLRKKIGDEIVASAGRGVNYFCYVKEINNDNIILAIVEEKPDISELPVKISLYQALPKADKLELVIQKAVELGVAEIIPIRTARCVVRLDEDKAKKKQLRWQKLSEEAAKQSGRGFVPEVHPVMDFSDAVKRASEDGYIVMPYELSDNKGLSGLQKKISDGTDKISVFIGSEGGFEASEVEGIASVGGDIISLGKRILRTETAAIAVVAHIMLLIEGKNS